MSVLRKINWCCWRHSHEILRILYISFYKCFGHLTLTNFIENTFAVADDFFVMGLVNTVPYPHFHTCYDQQILTASSSFSTNFIFTVTWSCEYYIATSINGIDTKFGQLVALPKLFSLRALSHIMMTSLSRGHMNIILSLPYCMLLSCYVRVSEWIYTLRLQTKW